ncbi:MFS transporter [Pseudooceanicola sediminis]|uniref:MFS transporter n=1 Tax=Pseudooceanicola sediminis TaxID=2211117 RepID=A0A399IZ30_9RHOB|nr:MFS transporter [Pseudooceanicola sediminis]KAA2313442.1 MFS transporter [Puniceibacterium sp. HSS470]RII38281.1 MFS transporter [Pseudooceanicola sediminis]|tara:strand:- start:28059 stop:29234 length:1176 start_codon:yes stop_codon:yes gene_type:complete
MILLRVFALFAAGLGAAAQFGKISVLFPAWAAAYPEAGATLGFLLSLISLIGVILGLVAGMVVARVGFRRMMIAALLLGAALSAVQSLMLPLPAMLVLRAVEGLSHLAIVVAAPTLMAEITDDKARPLAMSLWGTYFGVAFALYAVIGPSLLALGGLPVVLLSHAAYMVMLAGVLFLTLPDDRQLRAGAIAHPAQRLRLGTVLRRHAQAYASPFVAAPALGFLFYTATFVAILTVLPPYLPEATRDGLMTVLPVAGIITGLTLGAALLRLVPAVPVAICGFLAAAACALLTGLLPGASWPPVLLFCALGFVQGSSFASIPQINHDPADRALANGALAQMGNLGNFIGTPILLAMTGAMGLTGLVIFAVVAYCGGAALHLGAARMRKRNVLA